MEDVVIHATVLTGQEWREGELNGWQSRVRACVHVCVVRKETERPSSPAASRVIKIKAAVIGYSFWPRPVGYPFNGACVRGKKKKNGLTSGADREGQRLK